jgi:hypothetical protein
MNSHRTGLSIGALLTLSLVVMNTQAQTQKKKRGINLPSAVAAALKAECPDCVIAKVSREVEDGVKIYDFEFRKGQGEMDIAADGTIVNRETPIKSDDVPAAALEAIRKAASGGKIVQIEKDEIRAELKDGKITKLDSPKYDYEADLVKGARITEVVVTPKGQVTEGPKWRKKGTKED